MTRVVLLASALTLAPSFCDVAYSAPPSRCPELPCKLTGQIPCVSDDDCGNPAQSCQATACQSRCAFTRIYGECCDRPEDCASGICVVTSELPGYCGVGVKG